MQMNRSDLVELFTALGMPSAKNWDAIKLKSRANRLHIVTPETAAKLTKDAQATLFTAWAAIDAFEEGWIDGIELAPPPKRKKRKKTVHAFPRIRLSDRYARRLFAWLKKYGLRPADQKWADLTPTQRIDAVEEGVERLVMFFLREGEL